MKSTVVLLIAFANLFLPAARAAGLPDLVPFALTTPAAVTNTPDCSLTLSWTVTNQGSSTATGYIDGVFISTNSQMYTSADLVWTTYQTNITASLGPAASYSVTNTITLPVWKSGPFYVFVVTDLYHNVNESIETNNIISAPVTFYALPSDLAPATVLVPQSLEVSPASTISLAWAVTNQGPGGTFGYWEDAVYISTNKQWTSDATPLIFYPNPTTPAVGQTYWQTNLVSFPSTITSGVYYLLFRTDLGNVLQETNLSNNVLAVPIALTVHSADLAASSLTVLPDTGAQAYPVVTVVYAVTNLGPGSAEGSWTDTLILSGDDVLGNSDDTVVGSFTTEGPVFAGSDYWRTNVVGLPITYSGTYHLFLRVDNFNDLNESQLGNNIAQAPFTVVAPAPDIAPISFEVPTVVTSPPDPTLTVIYGVTNLGLSLGSGWYAWSDNIYISTNPVLDSTARLLHSSYEVTPFDGGNDYWRTNSLRLPITQSGNYWLFLSLDEDTTIIDSNRVNNVLGEPIALNILPPNLAPEVPVFSHFDTSAGRLYMQVTWGITNSGPGAAEGSWLDQVFLSSDAKLQDAEMELFDSFDSGLPAGGVHWQTNTFSVPFFQAASDYLIFAANPNGSNSLFESDFSDNNLAVRIAPLFQLPDVTPVPSRLPKSLTGPPYPTVTLVWGITNGGAGPVNESDWWDRALYFSSDQVLDSADSPLVSVYNSGPISTGGVLWLTNTVRLPVTNSGTYNFIIRANDQQYLFESDYSNNVVASPVNITIQRPDLAPIALRAPSSLVGSFFPSMTVSWGVTNNGRGAAVGNSYWTDRMYVSTKPTWDTNATQVFVDYLSGPISGRSSYWRTNTVQLPLGSSGTYYLFFGVNSGRELLESSYLNNLTSVPFQFTLRPADLAPISIKVPTLVTGTPNPMITYTWGVTNRGLGLAKPYPFAWGDAVSISSTNFWRQSDPQLEYFVHDSPLASGGVYWLTNSVRVPVTQSGKYNLVFAANVFDYPVESNFSNNTVVVPVTFRIQPPDLSPIALQLPTNITALPNPSLAIVWGITNQGVGMAGALDVWTDQLVFSPHATLDNNRVLVWSGTESTPVPAHGTYWRTNIVRIPVTQSGIYYLTLMVDVANNLFESNPTNNLAVVPVSFTIQNPPVINLKPRQLLPDGSFVLDVSAPASAYTLQTSDNLVDWVRATDFLCNGSVTITNQMPSPAARRFYRITSVP